ncbi:MAG TPA: hypothetical protein VKH81_20995 [Candidatus Angelobacter sp.]|nr:hypothetical protein [Candidatus Angelobacter sp.]
MDAVNASQGKRAQTAVLSKTIFILIAISLVGCGGFSGPSTAPQFDFSMAVSPATQSIVAGKGASYTITVNPAPLIGTINLSISGLPNGVEAFFESGFDINGSKNLGISTTDTTPSGTYQATITASDGNVTRTANISLTIIPAADFTLSVTPNLPTVKAGSSTNYVVNVVFAGAATTPVILSALGLPNGATASFAPASLSASGTSILTLTTDPEIADEINLFNIAGTDSAGTISIPASFDISPTDFTLDQTFGSVRANAGAVLTGQIDVNGTSGPVSLSARSLPPGVTASINPPVVTAGGFAAVTVTTDIATTPGSYTLEFVGADNSGQSLTRLPLSIAPTNASAGFFLATSPVDAQILAGNSTNYNIGVSAPGGTIPQLVFSVSSNLPDVTGAITNANNNPSTFLLEVSTSLSVGDNAGVITVTATGPDGSQSISVNLETSTPPPPD